MDQENKRPQKQAPEQAPGKAGDGIHVIPEGATDEQIKAALLGAMGQGQEQAPAELVKIEQRLDQLEQRMGKGTPEQEKELAKEFIEAITRAFFYRTTYGLPTGPVVERMERVRKASGMDLEPPAR
jgi:hypothetical protein